MTHEEHLARLNKIYNRKLKNTDLSFTRYLYSEIDWSLPFLGLIGARGTGKTTLLLQYLKQLKNPKGKHLYLSLDDIYFENNRLLTLAEELYEEGYRHLFLDEVHKYDKWSRDLKILHDNYHDLQIVFTGSSILDILKGETDLSRRAVLYHLRGLSLREYLAFENIANYPSFSLQHVLDNAETICTDIADNIDILKHFNKYVHVGYYPFYKSVKGQYANQLRQTINIVLESDIPAWANVDFKTVRQMKRLLHFIAQTAPFKPNISKLSGQIEITRPRLLELLDFLERAGMLGLLKAKEKSESHFTKPDMIYLDNSNLASALAETKLNVGSLRETFFFNQVSAKYTVHTPKYGDFIVNENYVFEVGGPNKTQRQISGVPNAYLAVDGTKYAAGNRIPLWIFGFFY